MADDTANGTSGDAPRTLFARGRGGKRKRGAAAESALENYPPADPDELSSTEGGGTDGDSAPADESGAPELCPSCAEALVPGALFCGECGTRVVPAAASAESGDADDTDDTDAAVASSGVDETDREAFVAFADGAESDAEADADPAVAAQVDRAQATGGIDGIDEGSPDEPDLAHDDPADDKLVAAAPVAAVVADVDLTDDGLADAEPVGATAAGAETEIDTEPEADDHDGAVPLVVAGGAAMAAGALAVDAEAPAGAMAAEPPPSYGEPAAAGAGTAGGGSKKGVWVAVAAVVLLIVGAVGAFALTSGSNNAKKTDQVAAGSSPSTSTSTTEGSSSTTASTDTTVAEVPITADPGTVTTASTVRTTPTTGGFVPPPAPPPTQPGSASLSAPCPNSPMREGSAIQIINTGTAPGSFHVTGTVGQVTFSPASGSVPAGAGVNVFVHFTSNFDGKMNVIMVLAGGGAKTCPVNAQHG